MSPSTLSDYLRGARPAPSDLASSIEKALGMSPGALNPKKRKSHPTIEEKES
jgi:DNA-binding transcriptional regulator YdaS (Cro superfamily)